MDDYPYIRAWNAILGSGPVWCAAILDKARSEGAPADATYNTRGTQRGGEWRTRSSTKDAGIAGALDQIARRQS